MSSLIDQQALEYHRQSPAGKLKVVATKPLANQQDLALAYSPGVGAACKAIVNNPEEVSSLTSRSNLVAVISNGTAVLGFGAIGPLAAKPVMEGKAVLFKKFAGIDCFDIEIQENDPDKLIDIIASLEPTFGGINLEDIKAPECFIVEQKLRERMKIPVFHDDQHGTAIIVAAAALNALKLVNKDISQVRLVTSGAGAAAIACLDILVSLGLKKENIIATDLAGVIYEGRAEKMDPFKEKYAVSTALRTLEEAIEGADIFLGLSAAGVLKASMVGKMASQPIIFALANPVPEILPQEVLAVRNDAIIATGRSDFPNQVNNVLCFPYIFRGALDVGATTINEAMKIACVKALADLTMAESSDIVAAAYGGEDHSFGPTYIIPKPFDPRIVIEVSSAVAKAAMETGVATRPITNFKEYRQKLSDFVFRSGLLMKPVFTQAIQQPKRVAFAEGEDERVLRAIQTVIDEKIAEPVVVGRREVVEKRIERLGLRIRADKDFLLIDPQNDHRYNDYWRAYYKLMGRRGVTPDFAKTILRTNTSVIGALLVHQGEADAVLCGPVGRYQRHLDHIVQILGLQDHVQAPAAMSAIVMDRGTYFICDSHITQNPTAEQLADITLLAAEQVRRFGILPQVALLSHSNFGTSDTAEAQKMRRALELVRKKDPTLEIEGEMHADSALCPLIRQTIFPDATLKGQANLLMMPNIDAANISFNMLKVLGDGMTVGPIILGCKKSAHILTPSMNVRSVVNMAALAVVGAS